MCVTGIDKGGQYTYLFPFRIEDVPVTQSNRIPPKKRKKNPRFFVRVAWAIVSLSNLGTKRVGREKER